jgi:phosphate transport system protein
MEAMQLLIEKKREALRMGLLSMAGRVTTSLRRSLVALRNQDSALCHEIVADDAVINQERRVLEQQALVVLASHQPAGRDLRLIGASLEMVTELERIADHAADVARILLKAPASPLPQEPAKRIGLMGDIALEMFEHIMAVYAENGSADRARAAVARENAVDALEEAAVRDVIAWLCDQQTSSSLLGMQLLWIAHHYERVADRATNIAERLIYIETGETPELN